MKTKILCWGWCMVIFHGVCAPDLLGRVVEGDLDDWNPFGSYQIGHEIQFAHSTPSTELDPVEGFAESEENNLRRRDARLERFGRKNNLLREKFKASETLGPLNKRFKYRAHSISLFSELSQRLIGFLTNSDTARFRALEALAKSVRVRSEGIGPIAEDLAGLSQDHSFEVPLFQRGARIERIIFTSLEHLQEEDLCTSDRLWTLSVLRILQSFLPRGYLDPIRQDPSTGRVCRGGLELFLTEGFEFQPMSRDISSSRTDILPEDEPTAEALMRVELIWNIKIYLEGSKSDHLTPIFTDIHDKLLLTKSLADPGICESLALQSMDHMNGENSLDEERVCLYHVLQHLQTFFPAAKNIVDSMKLKNKSFQLTQQMYQRQANLKPDIQEYLRKRDKDPYITSLLLPFTGWIPINSEYVKKLINSCHVQDSAMKESQSGAYGLDGTKQENYYKDQDFFFDMLYKMGPYVEGLQDHLKSLVGKTEGGHYQFITKLTFNKEDRSSDHCPVCLDKFLKGQRVAKLGCHDCHILHEHCTSNLILSSGERLDVKCPTCRKTLKIPLSHAQHIFWGEQEVDCQKV